MTIRLLLVDDHEIVREGLRTMLHEEEDIQVIGEAQNGKQAITLFQNLNPDVVLMDLAMPDMDGVEVTRRLIAQFPDAKILILTSYPEESRVREAVGAGVIGYLMKNILRTELTNAIRSAARGLSTFAGEVQRQLLDSKPQHNPFQILTERETDVLRLLAHGLSNKQIASTLSITEGTVKGYVSAILVKLEVDDRTQAALFAVKHGLT